VSEIVKVLHISAVSVKWIIPESFHVSHVSARWVSQNLSRPTHDRHWRVASSQELLGSYTSDEELFCRRFVTGDKTWIYHWVPLSKLEFLQWKDVDRHTFTRICKSAISFSGIQTGCL